LPGVPIIPSFGFIAKNQLEKTIANRLDFVFEITLGANTIAALLREAA